MSCCCSMQTEAAGARQGGDGASSLASMSGRQGGQRKGRKAMQMTGRPGGARRRGATRGHGREATGLARRRWGRGPAGGVRLGTDKGGGDRRAWRGQGREAGRDGGRRRGEIAGEVRRLGLGVAGKEQLRRRRRQGCDVLGQRGEAKPGGSERASVAGWRYGGDGVWRRTSEGSERRERWGSGARPLRAWVVAAEGNEEEG